jgi:hypothetical protein
LCEARRGQASSGPGGPQNPLTTDKLEAVANAPGSLASGVDRRRDGDDLESGRQLHRERARVVGVASEVGVAVAAQVLTAHGVALDAARRRTAEICGDGRQNVARWTHSPRATVVHRLAEVEAERLDQLPPEDAHLLLAMITEGGGIPNKLFAEFGVDVARMREDLLDALEVSDDARRAYLRQRRAAERARRQRASEQRQRDA